MVADDLVVLVDRRLEHLPHPLPLDPHPKQVPLLQKLVQTLANLEKLDVSVERLVIALILRTLFEAGKI